MSIVALQDLKDYARIDFSDDDAMLSAFLESAQVHIESFVGNKLDDATRFPDGTPAPLKLATKMLASHWYDNRELVSTGERVYEAPLNVFDLVGPYRTWGF